MKEKLKGMTKVLFQWLARYYREGDATPAEGIGSAPGVEKGRKGKKGGWPQRISASASRTHARPSRPDWKSREPASRSKKRRMFQNESRKRSRRSTSDPAPAGRRHFAASPAP